MKRLFAGAALLLAACQPEAVAPPPQPVAMTEEAVGHYCQMIVLEHDGPKAQVHVAHLDHPLWFSQVRDAIAFLRLPEETSEVRAVYVTDMGGAVSWEAPGEDNWTDASTASFVIESERRGGMGAPEAIPFADESAARAFAAENGGTVVSLDEIPDSYILAPVEVKPMAAHAGSTVQ